MERRGKGKKGKRKRGKRKRGKGRGKGGARVEVGEWKRRGGKRGSYRRKT